MKSVFTFLLLGIFAVVACLMVFSGARVYSSAASQARQHNDERIAGAYIRSRLREADGGSRLEITEHDGSYVMKITDPDEAAAALVYVYDGTLYEWYTLSGLADVNNIPAAAAEAVCAADEMTIEENGALITVGLRRGEEWMEVNYARRRNETRGEEE